MGVWVGITTGLVDVWVGPIVRVPVGVTVNVPVRVGVETAVGGAEVDVGGRVGKTGNSAWVGRPTGRGVMIATGVLSASKISGRPSKV